MRIQEKLDIRNKPLKRIRVLFLLMFLGLTLYILYFIIIDAETLKINDYNPRLEEIESAVLRGPILDRNGVTIAKSILTNEGQKRIYPYNNLFAHSVGYVEFGKIGLESYSNLSLIRAHDNLWDKLGHTFDSNMPRGHSVVTSFDVELQSLAYELLGDNKGAIVAIDPLTGDVLAMVSKPDFNPNTIASDYEELSSLEGDASFLNRATQGLYPPGSTYKTITTIAYLEVFRESDFFNYCMGEDFFGQKIIHCYNSKAHGRLDLSEAFAHSCNTSYAKVGDEIDPVRLGEISEQFLFNQNIPFELPINQSMFQLTSDSIDAEVTETVIGQGKTLITPLNNALIACAIANKGELIQPRVVISELNQEGQVTFESEVKVYQTIMTPKMAEKLQDYMTLTTEFGTARSIDTSAYQVASKTGSAENSTGPAHAWYIGYAPVDYPRIALAIIVENVGSSTVNAVPIADELFKHYLNNED